MTHFSKNSVLFVQTKILIFITKKSCSLFSAHNESNMSGDFKKYKEAQDEDEILKEISNGNDDINVIPKLRKLIVKIRASPQRKERFDRQSNLYSRNSLNLILDVKTRWNSTYLMLERALKLQEVSNFVYMIYIRELKQSIYKFVFY